MKKLLLTAGCLVAGVTMARTIRPAQLAPSPYADTEVSTNVPCTFDLQTLKWYQLVLELHATDSNNVVVTVGHDGNRDGTLSLGESALEFGWDSGTAFVRGLGGEATPEVEGPDSNGVSRISLIVPCIFFAKLYVHGSTKTNTPPAGLPPLMMTPRQLLQTPEPSAEFSTGQIAAQAVFVSVGTNEVWDFSPPQGATVVEKWRRRGAAGERIVLDGATGTVPPLIDRGHIAVDTFGRVWTLGRVFALLGVQVGMVPEANWARIGRESLAWWMTTPIKFDCVRNFVSSCHEPGDYRIVGTNSFPAIGKPRLVLGDVPVKLDGTITYTGQCNWTFRGTMTGAEDPYDFNAGNRGLLGEALTALGRALLDGSGTPYTIQFAGSEPLTGTGHCGD